MKRSNNYISQESESPAGGIKYACKESISKVEKVMKRTLIVLVLGLLSVGCLTPEQKLRDSVVGEYERKRENGDTLKRVFLENGVSEWYLRGGQGGDKWSIVNGEIHAEDDDIYVYRINKDQTITYIAYIRDEKRTDAPKDYHYTYKRIK